MNEKSWGKKFKELWVQPEDPTNPSRPAEASAGEGGEMDAADALIAKYAQGGDRPLTGGGAALSEAPSSAMPTELVDGKVDFVQVYEASGVSAEQRDRIKKAQDLLRALPAETPTAVKRQIVEASLRAFGVPVEQIIEAAGASTAALEGFVRAGQAETQKLLSEGAQRISQLEAEIANVKQIMDGSLADQDARTKAAQAEKRTLQDVLDFFGQSRPA